MFGNDCFNVAVSTLVPPPEEKPDAAPAGPLEQKLTPLTSCGSSFLMPIEANSGYVAVVGR